MLLVPLHPFTHTVKHTQAHTDIQLCVVWLDDSLVEIDFLFRDGGAKEEVTKSIDADFWNPVV